MLNDSYIEQSFRAKPGTSFFVRLAIAIWVTCMGIPLLMFVGGIGLIVAIIGICLFAYFLSYRNVEYEYTFTNSSVEIAIIYNASKRKELMHFDMEQVSMIVPKDSERIAHEVFNKKHDYTSRTHKELELALIVDVNGNKELVLMEVNEKSLAHIKSYSRNKYYDI